MEAKGLRLQARMHRLTPLDGEPPTDADHILKCTDVEELRQTAIALGKTVELLHTAVEESHGEVSEVSSAFESVQEDITNLNKQLTTQELNLQNSVRRVAAAKKELTFSKQENFLLTGQIEALTERMEQEKLLRQALKTSNETYKERQKELEEADKVSEDTIGTLTSQLAESNEQTQ
eukprot:Platyproteum_vivax@DN13025_c0_g1_i1.p1